MTWRDGITLQEAQAALLATVNAMYVIPPGEKSLVPQEHLAALEDLCDGGCGRWGVCSGAQGVRSSGWIAYML